jgi:5-formyltetrahydrofolate cyclo-ligase
VKAGVQVKKEIRDRILKRRDQMPLEIRTQKDLQIKATLFALPEFLSSQTILLYASFRSEVETLSMIRETLSMGKKVLLPKVNLKEYLLDLYEIRNISELSPGYMGIPEPSLIGGQGAAIEVVDLAVLPGAAFDLSGNRLGYGAGYYDALLSMGKKKIPLVALAYEEQLVDAIPAENHDVKVTIIVTDKRVVRLR